MRDRKNLLTEENLKVAFNHFDIDKDGKISVDEMVKQIFLKDKIEDIKPKLLNGFLNQLGITKDQKLSYEDFCKLIKSEEE